MRADRRLLALFAAAALALGCSEPDEAPKVIGDMGRLEQLAQAGDAVRIRDLLASDPGLAHASWASGQAGPLHLAAAKGHVAAVETLLDRGMSVDGRIIRGESALHAAASAGNVGGARVLLDRGASVNVRSHDGRTPLHESAIRDEPGVTDLLLSRGADPDLRDQDGRTPLHVAVQQARLVQVAALCAAGAETGIPDEARRTPLELARAEVASASGLKWAKAMPAWLGPGGPCEQLREKRRQGRPPSAGQREALVLDTRCAYADAWACGRVGRMYEEGEGGVEQDLRRALEYAGKGCAGDDGFACGNLAYAHMTGKGAPRDDARAAAMLLKGCHNGSAWSCSRLARFHRTGRGVPQDPIRAAELERKACEGGQKDACAPAAAAATSR